MSSPNPYNPRISPARELSPGPSPASPRRYDAEDYIDRSTNFGRSYRDTEDANQGFRSDQHYGATMGGWDTGRIWQRTNAPRERHRATVAETNVPDRHELFLLQDDERKVEVETISSVPNSAMFTFNREDHTLANLLRSRLLNSQHVVFAAYKVPHPLFPTFQLRIQTDGEVTPKDALVAACRDVVQDLASLGREFTKEWELKKMIGEQAGAE